MRIASFNTNGTPNSPTGGLTIDALLQRQKELAERANTIAAPRTMTSPWQGAAMMAQTFVNNRQESQAEDQLAAGRAALAQAVSGIDPNTGEAPQASIASAMALDPDTGLKLLQSSIEARRAARERQQHLDDVQAGYAHDDTLHSRDRAETAADRAAGYSHEETVDKRELGQAQAATKESQDFTASQADKARAASIEAAKVAAGQPDAPSAKILNDFKLGNYGDPNSPEAQALRDADLKKAQAIATPAGVNADRKALWDQQDQYIASTSAISQLKRASDLLGQGINTGYTSGAQTMWGKAGMPGGDPEQAKRTDEYNRIMNQEAITAMSQALKGATTDTEMAEFIKNMNDPTIAPAIKQRQIDTLLARAQAHNELQATRIKELGGDAPAVPTTAPVDEEALLQAARDAIAKNADPAMVKKRLVDKGIDPGKL